MTLHLVYLPVSPWSERARWALDHHRLAYGTTVHTPFLGERKLRKIVGSAAPRATVPVLLAGGQVLLESWEIARYADAHGSGSKLIPDAHAEEIRRFNTLADETMSAARPLIFAGMLDSPAALDESLPMKVPGFLLPLMRPTTRFATRWLVKKYALEEADLQSRREQLRNTLLELRRSLGTNRYLLGDFSYADIVMCSFLQPITPVEHRAIRLGPATRAVWTQPALATEFADLIAWRDRLYREHRPERARS